MNGRLTKERERGKGQGSRLAMTRGGERPGASNQRNQCKRKLLCLFRDHLYRLTLTSLTDLEHASWYAPEDKVNTCQTKGQSVEDCHNYVKVLLSNGKSLFTCGTYAFSPWCAWREVRLNGTGRGGAERGRGGGVVRPTGDPSNGQRSLLFLSRAMCVCVCVDEDR